MTDLQEDNDVSKEPEQEKVDKDEKTDDRQTNNESQSVPLETTDKDSEPHEAAETPMQSEPLPEQKSKVEVETDNVISKTETEDGEKDNSLKIGKSVEAGEGGEAERRQKENSQETMSANKVIASHDTIEDDGVDKTETPVDAEPFSEERPNEKVELDKAISLAGNHENENKVSQIESNEADDGGKFDSGQKDKADESMSKKAEVEDIAPQETTENSKVESDGTTLYSEPESTERPQKGSHRESDERDTTMPIDSITGGEEIQSEEIAKSAEAVFEERTTESKVECEEKVAQEQVSIDDETGSQHIIQTKPTKRGSLKTGVRFSNPDNSRLEQTGEVQDASPNITCRAGGHVPKDDSAIVTTTSYLRSLKDLTDSQGHSDDYDQCIKNYVSLIVESATSVLAAEEPGSKPSAFENISREDRDELVLEKRKLSIKEKKEESKETELPPLILHRPCKFEPHSTRNSYLSYPPLSQLPYYPKLAFPRSWGAPLMAAEPRTVLVGFTCPPAPKFRQDQLMIHPASTLRRYYNKPCIKSVEWIKVFEKR